jgi:hypothetical protein
MTTKLEAIRALNDELRQNLTTGTAFLTTGVAALGAEAVARIVKTIAVYDDFCHAMIHTRNMTLGRSRSMARRSFSRSIISTRRSPLTRRTQLIRRSPSA